MFCPHQPWPPSLLLYPHILSSQNSWWEPSPNLSGPATPPSLGAPCHASPTALRMKPYSSLGPEDPGHHLALATSPAHLLPFLLILCCTPHPAIPNVTWSPKVPAPASPSPVGPVPPFLQGFAQTSCPSSGPGGLTHSFRALVKPRARTFCRHSHHYPCEGRDRIYLICRYIPGA